MSGKIATGGGEINCFEETPLCANKSNLADVIAGEIVNEILENALDIATCANDTGIPWKEIRSAVSISDTSINVAEGKKEKEEHKSDLCTNIVGDIIHKMGISPTPTISEILDSLNKMNRAPVQPEQPRPQLETEMKMLLSEMLSTPYELNFDAAPVKGGVGDQPFDKAPTQLDPEPSKAIEKKSRVTDLVKNSPQLITEYLLMDEISKQNQEEWEESEEKIIQVIELDHVKPGEEQFRCHKLRPEEVPLPDDNDDDLYNMPKSEDMDLIDLSTNICKLRLPNNNENSSGAKGDDTKNEGTISVELPQITNSCGGEDITVAPEDSSKEGDISESEVNVSNKKSKKKKWNFGSKLLGFLKRGHKKQEQSTSVHNPL